MKTPTELLADLVALPGPPGQEDAVRDYLAHTLEELGMPWRVDAKGNFLCGAENPKVIVTAHLDEIALMVAGMRHDGSLAVIPLGGVQPWKWGEGPVEVLPLEGGEPIPGVLSFGSIHTSHPATAIERSRAGNALTWGDARVLISPVQDIPVGSRVVMARSRRTLWPMGDKLGSYFLDDRADLAAWLKVIEAIQGSPKPGGGILFAATASEELGGHGALWLLGNTRPEVCIALEIGPIAPDNAIQLSAPPTCWVTDGYAPTDPKDIALVQRAAQSAKTGVQLQALTRGGSDASCAAAQGLCARPITLAFPCENTHGFEIMHKDAMGKLAALTRAVLEALEQESTP
jgi:putative aminopeptidase FrvX